MTEQVEFKGERPDEGLAGSYVPFVPAMVKMISNSNIRPPLITDGVEATEYEVDKMPFVFVPYLVFREAGGEWSVETPLGLCHYVKPDKDSQYNLDVCAEAVTTNAIREQHNKFIVDTLRVFMKRYDCGVSAGVITMPPPPENPIEARLSAIKRLTSDKLDTAKRAIEYCAIYGCYCGRDYEFDKALEKANDVCFDETVKARSGEGKKNRVRLEGRRPSWWDGVSPKDKSGKHVMWKRGEGHTFLTPNVIIAEAPVPCTDLQVVDALPSDMDIVGVKNPFDELFPPPAGPLLTQ